VGRAAYACLMECQRTTAPAGARSSPRYSVMSWGVSGATADRFVASCTRHSFARTSYAPRSPGLSGATHATGRGRPRWSVSGSRLRERRGLCPPDQGVQAARAASLSPLWQYC